MPHKAITPIRQLQPSHAGQEDLGLEFNRLCEKPPGAGPQDIRQGIVDLVGLTKPDDAGICVHGVSLVWGFPCQAIGFSFAALPILIAERSLRCSSEFRLTIRVEPACGRTTGRVLVFGWSVRPGP